MIDCKSFTLRNLVLCVRVLSDFLQCLTISTCGDNTRANAPKVFRYADISELVCFERTN